MSNKRVYTQKQNHYDFNEFNKVLALVQKESSAFKQFASDG